MKGSANVDIYFHIASAIIIILLAGLVIAISFAQSSTKHQDGVTLEALEKLPVSQSFYFRIAKLYFEKIGTVQPTRDYLVGLAILILLIMGLSAVAIYGHGWSAKIPDNFIFGHTDTTTSPVDTLRIQAWAFIGAYVFIIHNLVNRVNNNDVYPITFHYYINRLVIATLLAAWVAHIGDSVKWAIDSQAGAIGVGFVLGWMPIDWVKGLVTRISDKSGILSSQKEPDPKTMPSNLSLLLIEGLTQDKRERLSELLIDNAHTLANHNPFIVWARTSFQLLHIMDWIAQAQLLVLVKEEGLHRLRFYGVRDIFALEVALAGQSMEQVGSVLGWSRERCADALKYLRESPEFARLYDVNAKLTEGVSSKPDPVG